MFLALHKYLPGGNPTILVDNLDLAVQRVNYGHIAETLMKEPYVGGEQVGFVEKVNHDSNGAGRLWMMGGELCLNATLCFGHYIAEKTGLDFFYVNSSGTEQPFAIVVNNELISIELKLVSTCIEIKPDFVLVLLEGIAHFIMLCPQWPEDADMECQIRDLTQEYSELIGDRGAVGLIYVQTNRNECRIKPLVYVKASGSMIFETACGSGSVATFQVLNAHAPGKRQLQIIQPSETIIEIEKRNEKISLTTTVKKIFCGLVKL